MPMIPRSYESKNPRPHDFDNTKIRAPLGVVKLVDSLFPKYLSIFREKNVELKEFVLYVLDSTTSATL
jgi:hypothetical protein